MQKIFIVSKYLQRKGYYHVFHFTGYFNGVKVKQVHVYGGDFVKDEEYAIALHQVKINGDILTGKLLQQKRLYGS